MSRRHVVCILFLLAMACAGCGGSQSYRGGTHPLDPLALLPRHPVSPQRVSFPEGDLRVDWRQAPGPGRIREGDACSGGKGAARNWTDGGVKYAFPSVLVRVCVFESKNKAREMYDSASVFDEDLPNFDTGTNEEKVPTGVDTLASLAAEEQKIGCGTGAADQECGVWRFQAHYGRMVWVVAFSTSPGAITFEQMRALIRSIDRVIAANASA